MAEQPGPPVEVYDANAAYQHLLEDLPPKRSAYSYVVGGVLGLILAVALASSPQFGWLGVIGPVVFAVLMFILGFRILYLNRMRNRLERSGQRKSNFDD